LVVPVVFTPLVVVNVVVETTFVVVVGSPVTAPTPLPK
jgi:hypothetical protein